MKYSTGYLRIGQVIKLQIHDYGHKKDQTNGLQNFIYGKNHYYLTVGLLYLCIEHAWIQQISGLFIILVVYVVVFCGNT